MTGLRLAWILPEATFWLEVDVNVLLWLFSSLTCLTWSGKKKKQCYKSNISIWRWNYFKEQRFLLFWSPVCGLCCSAVQSSLDVLYFQGHFGCLHMTTCCKAWVKMSLQGDLENTAPGLLISSSGIPGASYSSFHPLSDLYQSLS